MSDRQSIAQLLAKVNELKERGEDGEATAAARILQTLLTKYGLTIEDIETRELQIARFIFKTPSERQLLIQIAAKIAGESLKGYARGQSYYLELTAAQAIEIRDWFNHYRRELAQEIEVLQTAFFHRHKLLVKPKDGEAKTMTREEWDKFKRMLDGLSSADYIPKSRQIEQQSTTDPYEYL